ncbi:glycosyltransferase family 2 protein [Calothrix rhizosoleniae]|uniref:glycosyltransferase family 2 protein n=1 Tax=Calothrix rhizosoleniae TaxID=888997 RepID=UPI000B4A4416|nr:glycosyltransferase [Calothrix rhizosoleniae]
MKILQQVGVVIIGRNEGQLLKQCLMSVVDKVSGIVYVDSGSTDGSVEIAKSLEVDVVELDLSIPFTAARARNEGLDHLLTLNQQIRFVQFVDGDCEVVEGWLESAQRELESQPQTAVVCGRRQERFPGISIYNQLCDIEWNTPIGETKMCGGDAMMRVEAFKQVNGFNPSLIAGEEPELCVRLRQQGWKILRIDKHMTLHDARMTNFSQWWKRSLRAGHAYAEGFWLHGHSAEGHCLKESRSIWLLGLILPLLSLATAWSTSGLSLLLFTVYPVIVYRSYCDSLQKGFDTQDAVIYALFCVLSKFPGVQGQIKFHLDRLLGRGINLVEYK